MFYKKINKLLTVIILGSLAVSGFSFAEDKFSAVEKNNSQFNAPETHKKKQSSKAYHKQEIVNSWKPYCIKNRYLGAVNSYFFNANVGCGFLYFSGISIDPTATLMLNKYDGDFSKSTKKIQGRLGYNRTPIVDVNLGVKIFEWMSCSLSYMHQGGVAIQSKVQKIRRVFTRIGENEPFNMSFQFFSNLALDSILANISLNLPSSMIWKKLTYNPYLGLSVGPGWQTWSHSRFSLTLTDLDDYNYTISYNMKQKVSANVVWFADLGCKLRSVIPNINFSVRLGTKFIGWGQALQIGLPSQDKSGLTGAENTGRLGVRQPLLYSPFKIKYVYSFAPYIGVQWDF